MRKQISDTIRRKVKEAYNGIAQEFDMTRQREWPEFADFTKYINKNAKILDLGCGNGRLYRFLKGHNIDYTGLDNSSNLIEKASEDFPEAKFITGDMSELDFPDCTFNNVFSIASFHHLPGKKLRKKTVNEIHRVLKPGGIAVVMVWNLFQKKYIFNLAKAVLSFIFSAGLKYAWNDLWIKWSDNPIKRYYHAFLPKELLNCFDEKEWQIKEFCFFKKGARVKFLQSYNICLIAEKK